MAWHSLLRFLWGSVECIKLDGVESSDLKMERLGERQPSHLFTLRMNVPLWPAALRTSPHQVLQGFKSSWTWWTELHQFGERHPVNVLVESHTHTGWHDPLPAQKPQEWGYLNLRCIHGGNSKALTKRHLKKEQCDLFTSHPAIPTSLLSCQCTFCHKKIKIKLSIALWEDHDPTLQPCKGGGALTDLPLPQSMQAKKNLKESSVCAPCSAALTPGSVCLIFNRIITRYQHHGAIRAFPRQ